MDLLVYTDGALRDISGVSETTTCAQVVYALAHATNQKGRFVLVANFSNTDQEHRLTPNERPYELLLQCADQGVEVSFELRKVQPPQHHPVTLDGQQINEGGHCNSQDQVFSAEQHSKKASTSSSSSSSAQMEMEIERIRRSGGDGGRQEEVNTPTASSSCTALPDGNLRQPLAPLPHQISLPMLRGRPPPPSYNKIIEQRCNSLTRAKTSDNNSLQPHANKSQKLPTFGELLNLSANDLYGRNFSREDLANFLEAQSQLIAVQRKELASLELTLSNDQERELVQLKKQHNNLQTVLNSLRNANWPRRVENERIEAERLNTAIDAMKTAIENKRRELHQVLELHHTLELQYAFEISQQQCLEEEEDARTRGVLSQMILQQKSEAIS